MAFIRRRSSPVFFKYFGIVILALDHFIFICVVNHNNYFGLARCQSFDGKVEIIDNGSGKS